LKRANSGVVVTYYSTASALKLDLENGSVDVGFRTFSPTDLAAMRKETDKGVQVVEGKGADISYMVFNTKIMPGNSPAQKLAVRKAAAYAIDRPAIANSVYNGTVNPLYSMVPSAFAGAGDNFKQMYGASANAAKAKSTLTAAGVSMPVKLDIWYTPSHYGETSADLYTTIKRQLEATGAFKINLHSAEWEQYSNAYPTDQYQAFQLGWFPDYPDADDYVNPFYASGKASFLNDHFADPAVDKALTTERGATDQSVRVKQFQAIQQIGAEQVPIIPFWRESSSPCSAPG